MADRIMAQRSGESAEGSTRYIARSNDGAIYAHLRPSVQGQGYRARRSDWEEGAAGRATMRLL